jgi:hypothetical protein
VDAQADWFTPLIAAASTGHNDMVALLLDHGAQIDRLDCKDGYSALMMAAYHGQTETIRLLMSRGADVHLSTEWFVTALQMAERAGQRRAAEVLRHAGAEEPIDLPPLVVLPWGVQGDPMQRAAYEAMLIKKQQEDSESS